MYLNPFNFQKQQWNIVLKKHKMEKSRQRTRSEAEMTPALDRRMVRVVEMKNSKDHIQGHPCESGLCWWQYLKTDSSADTTQGWVQGGRPWRMPGLQMQHIKPAWHLQTLCFMLWSNTVFIVWQLLLLHCLFGVKEKNKEKTSPL